VVDFEMKFDKEYGTQWILEVDYLSSKGIKPVFIKRDNLSLIKTYKYVKTNDLFKALTEFYLTQK